MNETGPIDFEPYGKSAFCFYLQLFADSDIFHLKASKRQNGILVPVFFENGYAVCSRNFTTSCSLLELLEVAFVDLTILRTRLFFEIKRVNC